MEVAENEKKKRSSYHFNFTFRIEDERRMTKLKVEIYL